MGKLLIFICSVALVIGGLWVGFQKVCHEEIIFKNKEVEVERVIEVDKPVFRDIRREEFEITCYCLSGLSKTEQMVDNGMVASDPDYLPLGTVIHIPGYGYGITMDTGGDIKGSRLDVWNWDCEWCLGWGSQTLMVEIYN